MSVIIVKGRPASIGASPGTKNRWKSKVKEASKGVIKTPLNETGLKITITFFYISAPDFDIDNVSKPICDALEGIAYQNDSQLSDRYARRRHIESSYRFEDVDPKLVSAIAEGNEFVAIQIEIIDPEVI